MSHANQIEPKEREGLLKRARAAIAQGLGLAADMPSPGPSRRGGAFVTLHARGRLRGCIGTFEEGPLEKTVERMARAAAFEDPRFPPLDKGEFSDIELEISVLSPMRQVESVEEIEVGRHGLYLVVGPHRGVLLPQVAVEQGWDRARFLEGVSMKAGLGPRAWQDPAARLLVFTAEVFGEAG